MNQQHISKLPSKRNHCSRYKHSVPTLTYLLECIIIEIKSNLPAIVMVLIKRLSPWFYKNRLHRLNEGAIVLSCNFYSIPLFYSFFYRDCYGQNFSDTNLMQFVLIITCRVRRTQWRRLILNTRSPRYDLVTGACLYFQTSYWLRATVGITWPANYAKMAEFRQKFDIKCL